MEGEGMRPAYILRDTEVREHAIARIRCLNLNTPEPWALYIAPHKQIRTLEQNAAYWRIVGKIVAATGHSKNVVHTLLKKEALGVEMAEINGKVVEAPKESSKSSRGDFSELIDHAHELAAGLGVPVE
jgi:hypothetical protein